MNAQTITDLALKAYRGDTHAQVKVTRAFVDMCSFHENLLLDIKMLEHAISHGRLDVRADPEKYSGEYRKIIDSMNTTLDAVTGPLKMSIDCTRQLSRGICPSKITDVCYGDVNQIKNNLNNCIDLFNTYGKDTRSSVQDTINYQKIPTIIHENSNFSEGIDDTAHIQRDLDSLHNPISNASVVFPGVLSTINLQVSDIAAQNLRTKMSTTKLASDTARVARSADAVQFHAGRGEEKVKEIFKGMKELSAGIDRLSSDTDAVSRLAKKTYQISGAAAEHADKFKKDLTAITRMSSDAGAQMSDVFVLVDRIGDNTSHILTLSDRIKMLAANVSTDREKPLNFQNTVPGTTKEIKLLAEASRESAEKITSLIKDLQKKSRLAKSALDLMNNDVKTRNAVFNETSELLYQVAGSVEQISRNLDDVLAASRSQGKSVMKLSAKVQNVDYVVKGTAESVSDVAKTCKDTSSCLYQVAQDMADVNRIARNVATGTAKYQK